MIQSVAGNLPSLAMDRPLAALIRRGLDEPVLARNPVTGADLTEAVSEAWRDACLRAGHPDVTLSATPMRLAPRLADHSESRCVGFDLEVILPDGRTTRREFTISCLRPAVDRAVKPLLEAEVLKPGDPYIFEFVVASDRKDAPPPAEADVPLTLSLRSAPLTYLRIPIRTLLERATPVAILDDEEFPVFYTPEALAKAEVRARRGREVDPPVETGGVLLGSLAACPDSGELAAIIADVIEVQEADQTTFSLSYTSRSWMRIQAILKARQAAYPHRAERLLGQTHGHSFMPNDGKACAECDRRATCSLTSVFVSQDDQTWHRAVFARQPWALCHIFGLTARGQAVDQLYGLKDGRLQARGYYLLPDRTFDR